MASEKKPNEPTHIIDPDGDVMIVLRNVNTNFTAFENAILDMPPILFQLPDINGSTKQNSIGNQDIKQDNKDDKGFLSDNIIYIQASARHLAFASPFFKKILTGDWKESVTFKERGSVEITMEGWDIEALLILLKIIHCRNSDIPRRVTLKTLAKIAVLLDYYECKESAKFFTDTWVTNMAETIPKGIYSREVILWIWVSWFFQLKTEFRAATSTAMSRSSRNVDSLGLPIPGKVLGAINARKYTAISRITGLINSRQHDLLCGKLGCNFDCSSIMYGALSKNLHSIGLTPTLAFVPMDYTRLVQHVSSFKMPKRRCEHGAAFCSAYSFPKIFGKLDDTVEGLDMI